MRRPWRSPCRQNTTAARAKAAATTQGTAAHHQRRHVSTQLLQFAVAGGALLQMPFQRDSLLALQYPQGIECEVLRELFVYIHAKALRRLSNPARMRVFTVPSGSPVLAEISV